MDDPNRYRANDKITQDYYEQKHANRIKKLKNDANVVEYGDGKYLNIGGIRGQYNQEIIRGMHSPSQKDEDNIPSVILHQDVN